ncbi:hypothetical protein ACLB2K_058324 [Fragaria x ananassa]
MGQEYPSKTQPTITNRLNSHPHNHHHHHHHIADHRRLEITPQNPQQVLLQIPQSFHFYFMDDIFGESLNLEEIHIKQGFDDGHKDGLVAGKEEA